MKETAKCAAANPAIALWLPLWPLVGRIAGSFGTRNAGWFEQEATEGTETDSILCFLGYLLLNSETGQYRGRGRGFLFAWFAWFAVTFPAQQLRRSSLYFCRERGMEIFE